MIYAGLLEYIWSLVAFAGLLAALLNWSEAKYDWNKWKDSPVASQRFMVTAIYETAKLILLKHAVSTAGALWAISHPPPPPDITLHTMPQGFGSSIVLVTLSCLMTLQAIRGIRYRRHLSHGDYGERTRRSTDTGVSASTTTDTADGETHTVVQVPTPAPVTEVEFTEKNEHA